MRKRKLWLSNTAFALAVILSACRTPAPAPKPTPSLPFSLPTETPTGNIISPVPQASRAPVEAPSSPIPVSPTSTDSPPTFTPLPHWPQRWEPTGGPEGGMIEALAIHATNPSTLYAAGMGGAVYKSGDQGETWSPGERLVPPSCSFVSLIIDAADNNTVYGANPCAGVLKSSDGGTSWVRTGGEIAGSVLLIAQSPYAPGLLLAADHGGDVYRSSDSALTWELIGDGLPGETIRALAASSPETYWATTTNGNDGALYRFNSGVWSAVSFGQLPGTEATNVLVDPQDPAILYVGVEYVHDIAAQPDSTLLYRSTDAGASWSPLQTVASPANTDGEVAETTARVYVLGKGQLSGALYIADNVGLLSTIDEGETWHRIELPEHASAVSDLRQIAIDPTNNDVLYLPLRSAGIVRSTDGGRTWDLINNGLNSTTAAVLAAHPTDPATLYAASGGDANTFKTSNYGDSWTRLDVGAGHHPNTQRGSTLAVDPNQPDRIYQVMDTARVYRSDDSGGTWAAAWPEFRFSSIYSLAIAPSDPDIIYANKNGFGLFRSDDAGNRWRFLSQSTVDYTYALAIHPENADFILSGDNRKSLEAVVELHRSRDGGVTWDESLTIPDATAITSVVFDLRVEPFFRQGKQPSAPTRLYAASAGPRGTLWFSNDAGDSWKPLNDDLNFTNIQALAVAPHKPGVAFAGLWGSGTWRTEDGGLSWQRLAGDPATSAIAVAVDPSNHNIVYIADATAPHLYRSTDDGGHWELLFDAGTEYDRLVGLALAPSDPSIVYVSITKAITDTAAGAVFRIDADAPTGENANDVTGDLPGTPSSLAVHRLDARRIFAVVPGAGAWKTLDGGASWRQIKGGLPDVNFYHIAVDPIHPETLFLAGGHKVQTEPSGQAAIEADDVCGVWKSTDDGNTWRKVGGATFGQASGPIKAIAFHPQDERVLYAAGEKGIYLSPDRGETWTDISGRLPYIPMNTVATDGQNLYAGSGGAGVFAGVIHPLIHTADWSPESHLAAPTSHIQIVLHPEDPQILYASAYPGGVFRTSDGGMTWAACNAGLPSFAVPDPSRQGYYALAIAPSAPEVLYLGLYAQGVFRSDDGGATWRPVFGEKGELQNATSQTLLVHPHDPDVVYVATEEGVWRSANGGQRWSEFNAGLAPGGDVRTLALGTDNQLYAGTRGYGLYTRSAFHQAEDDAWRQLPAIGNWGTPSLSWGNRPLCQQTSILIHPGDPDTLYAGTFPAGIFKTADGATWREHNVGLENDDVLTLVSNPADRRVLYAGTTDGIARSIDAGETWHPSDTGWPLHQQVASIAIEPTAPETLYACSRNGEIPEQAAGTVMKSIDGGASWFEITTGLNPDQAFLTILLDRFDPHIVYLATWNDGIYISRNSGATWTSWNEGLWNHVAGTNGPNVKDVLQLSADGRLLYLGTSGSGVWRRPAEGAP
jgi:photosystem II stability/assembly factor-like uncharacterized protein